MILLWDMPNLFCFILFHLACVFMQHCSRLSKHVVLEHLNILYFTKKKIRWQNKYAAMRRTFPSCKKFWSQSWIWWKPNNKSYPAYTRQLPLADLWELNLTKYCPTRLALQNRHTLHTHVVISTFVLFRSIWSKVPTKTVQVNMNQQTRLLIKCLPIKVYFQP